VDQARTGDEDAWRRVFWRIYPRLLAYATRQVGPEAAEDVVAETMTKAVAGIDRFRWQPAGFDAWLFGIARHVCSDHHRHNSRARRTYVSVPMVEPAAPGDRLERDEAHAELQQLFARLSPADQQLLELRVIAGLSAEETAAVLGRRAGAVRTAQSRALARLRRMLEGSA
jgi:RNA polymerase sigma-70 factor (ECF subfamily)